MWELLRIDRDKHITQASKERHKYIAANEETMVQSGAPCVGPRLYKILLIGYNLNDGGRSPFVAVSSTASNREELCDCPVGGLEWT